MLLYNKDSTSKFSFIACFYEKEKQGFYEFLHTQTDLTSYTDLYILLLTIQFFVLYTI